MRTASPASGSASESGQVGRRRPRRTIFPRRRRTLPRLARGLTLWLVMACLGSILSPGLGCYGLL